MVLRRIRPDSSHCIGSAPRSIQHSRRGESGADARCLSHLKAAQRLLARGVGFVVESLPLDLLRSSRPGSANLADEITELASAAQIDEPKLNHFVVLNAGVGSIRIPKYLCHGSMVRRAGGFGCDLSHMLPGNQPPGQ